MIDGRVRLSRRLEASRAAIARGIVHPQRPHTDESRGHSCAHTDERHEMHGEGQWTGEGAVCGKAWSMVTVLLTPYPACTALSAESVLAVLASAFDLAVHPVNLCQHVFRPGLHLQIG